MVHFTPGTYDAIAHAEQPLAATVAYVWHDRLVNLSVLDFNGVPNSRTSVPLLQDDAVAPEGSPYCLFPDWSKAAKAEALNAGIDQIDGEPK
jgi:hypothetical protein